MSVLHAWGLALGLAAAVPFILHLRRRRTDRRVAFPALRYLSRAEDARSRSLVASDVLLLAIRMGLVAALALAAAGPLLGRGGAGDHTPTDLALVVDNSASTGRFVGDRSLFEVLLARARTTLAAMRPEDRVWVFPTVGPAVATGVGGPQATEALSRIALGDGAADLGEAVGRASAALPAERDRRREVELLSDAQASAFSSGIDSTSDGAPLVAWLPPPPEEANAAVADIQLTGGATVPSGIGHGVIARPVRLGPGARADTAGAEEAALRLQIDGRIAGAARVPWGSSGTLGLPELDVGTHVGQVEVDPAGTRADDTRFFSIEVVPPPVVRFIGPEESFVAFGIETLREAGRLGTGATPSVTVVEGTPDAADASPAVLASTPTLVLVPPVDPVDVTAFDQLLSGLGIPWTLRVDPERGSLALRPAGTAFPLTGVEIRRRYLLRAVPGAAGVTSDTSILSTEDGEPWLLRTREGETTVLLLASPLVPEATDLPAHPSMIPFLESLLVRWSHLSGWPPSDFDVGLPVPLPEWARAVGAPTDGSTAVEGGGRYTPLRAGVYRVTGTDALGAAREARFAANVPEAELDPTPLGERELGELFPGRPVFTAGPAAGDWRDAIFRSRRGRDAAPWLLGLALALAAAELFLATPGRARRRARGSGPRDGSELEQTTGATQTAR